jgi:hypothetical protein
MGSGQTLQYRFDHLLLGHFYHLDLTFYLCVGTRQISVLVDGLPLEGPITVDQTPKEISLRLDPAFYADRTITVGFEKTGTGLGGPVISALKLTDIRYCYRDSGNPGEVSYANATDGCGYLDGFDDQSWGSLPYQTVRYDDDGNVRYRFDGLAADKQYQLNLTFYEGDGAKRVESIIIDGQTVASGINLSAVPQYLSYDVPVATYSGDGWIEVNITGTSQPVVNEIALEQKTLGVCSLFGDLNGDRRVDVADIMMVASRWRCKCWDSCYNSFYDIDGDCDIDIVDIMLVVKHWGESCG